MKKTKLHAMDGHKRVTCSFTPQASPGRTCMNLITFNTLMDDESFQNAQAASNSVHVGVLV